MAGGAREKGVPLVAQWARTGLQSVWAVTVEQKRSL